MENEQHHYIPQCYLRNFSIDKKAVFVWDKRRSKNYLQAINKICCLKDLYRIDPECIEMEKVDPLLFENKYFAKNIEPEYSRYLRQIIQSRESNNSQKIFSNEDKFLFAYLLGIQWYRLPQQKRIIHSFKQEILEAEIDIIKSFLANTENDPSFKDLKVKPQTNPSIDHAEVYTDNELLEGFANAVSKNYWEFYYTNKNVIYTSDFPMVIEPHVKSARSFYEGFGMYGAEFSIPISSNIVLVIWDSDYFKNKEKTDCHFLEADAKTIRRYNLMRYFYAKEKVFSQIEDFTLIKTCKELLNNGNELFIDYTPKYKVYHG